MFLPIFEGHGEISLPMEQRTEFTEVSAIKSETVTTEDVADCVGISNHR
jgi:hypothetical protein